MDNTLSYLQKIVSNWHLDLKLGVKYNTPINIGITPDTAELITCMEENIKGTGSISHGFDHDNTDETKSLSLVQPKKCDNCKGKVHFFTKKCNCGGVKFEYINDSRWGIDCEAHFKYNPKGYHLWIFRPDKYNFDVNSFTLCRYYIDSTNKQFNDILSVQLNEGRGKSKNFLPDSKDFYTSKPIVKSKFRFTLESTLGFVVERLECEEIKYDKKVIKKMGKYLIDEFEDNKDIYLYEELVKFLDVYKYKTNHGKERGKTSRRIK